jgi:DNA (cytosine-5)-methyltransferase 1
MTIKFIDLFCGIGGFRKGIEDAAKELNIPVKCVFSSEIEKNAVKIYEKNFGDVPSGDITKISANDIGDFDILCGGFPCQDVSTLGKRGGLCASRTGLFFDVIRIAKEKQPKIIFLENVKGLLTSNKGWDFARVIVELEDIGYEVEAELLDSKDFGVPHRRKRVYIIGHLRTAPTNRIFPIIREEESICNESREKPKGVRNVASTLTKLGHDKWNENYVRYSNGDIRTLTPIECERLQGYPDNWTAGVSDKYRYECLGNTVTVNVVKAVATKILQTLSQ